jgi:hypothetical protein
MINWILRRKFKKALRLYSKHPCYNPQGYKLRVERLDYILKNESFYRKCILIIKY